MHSSSSLYSLWLQPLNHKYSPAGNQARADMNPEAQQDVSVSQGVRMMFYMMKPNETSFQTLEEVPDYVKQATPFFISLMLLELVVSWILKGKAPGRLDDALTSMSAGILSRLPRSIELTTYIYIWENYRLIILPWDSPWTWYLTFLGVDFGYYWFHRMAHEVNIMWIFYSPLIINNLGPLELILNTPSHHRVHHGRNRYCIDKNYAGVLIIWDRIFGTFEAENEKVVYGLTHPINTFEPFMVQCHHLVYIWTTFWATPGFFNKFSVLFKGPGWSPGKPRLGLSEEIPEVTGKEVPFSSSVSHLLRIYAVVQFALMLAFYEETFADKARTITSYPPSEGLLHYSDIDLHWISFGSKAAVLETFRCLVFLMLCRFGHLKPFTPSLSFALEKYPKPTKDNNQSIFFCENNIVKYMENMNG
ncbi:alkylglycerol monooxygenase isoform X3 [Prionailurus iriomotensis]